MLGEKMKKTSIFRLKFDILGLSPSQNWLNVLCYGLEMAKILLKNPYLFWSYLEKNWGGQNDPP